VSVRSATILVVDDDKKISEFLRELLTESGYSVRVASNGREALDRLATSERDEIDLVLLDVMMPEVDGYTVCRRLKSSPETQHLAVIMCTGRNKLTDIVQGLNAGADDYIGKPFHAQELLARVNAMLRLHRAEQSLLARNRALAALNAVSQTIGRAVELPDVLSSALDQVMDSLDLTAGMITLRSAAGRQVVVAQRGPLPDLASELDAAEQTAQSDQPLAVPAPVGGACVPLRSRNRVLGTLLVVGSNTRGDEALALLATIGSQIGAAIERARLYEDAQRRSEDFAVLNEITRAITSSLELDRVLTTSLHSIRQMLHVQAGSLILIDADTGEMNFRNTLDLVETWIRSEMPWSGAALIARVINSREPTIVNDASTEPRPATLSDQLIPRSVLAVPLIVKSRAVGAIVVVNKLAGPFTSDDLELLQFLAAAVAIAAENARLYGELADFARELERSQAQLIQAEKLAATGRLAASMAHEINNPLQAIHNCLHLISRPITDEKKQRYLLMAQEEVMRLMTLVQRTLEFYRPSKGKLSAGQCNDLIDNVLALSGKRLEHGHVQVHTQLMPDLPGIAIVPDQITQVLLNLVINAVEAMPNGGDLWLATFVDGGWLRIAVRDNGQGISPDEAAKIFEPFYTTKATGTGLGLAVSYGIIQQHGGRIDVAGAPGEGTTFTVSLPLERPSVAEQLE
jgi:signal transduction histidine kinase/DNA-binding response OmpR family regulator